MSEQIAESGRLVVRSEEDAWRILEQATEGQISDDAPLVVVFRGWPSLEVYIPVTPVDSSITPTMMQAFIDYQEAIYRTHSLLTDGSPDLRGLTKADKERLEIRVKVTAGSNNYVADVAPSVERIALELVAKMPPTHLVITIIAVSLIAAGVVGWKWWLQHRTEVRKSELEADGRNAQAEALAQHLASMDSQREHETRRFQMLADLTRQNPVIKDIERVVEPARTQITRAVGEEGGGRVQGLRLVPEHVAEVTSQRRNQSVSVRLEGIYRVAKVDTTVSDGFRVTLLNTATNDAIVCSVQDIMLSEEHRIIIQRAEWNKFPIKVQIEARKIGERLADAMIMSVEEAIDPRTAPAA